MPDRWMNCLSESYENQQGEPNLENSAGSLVKQKKQLKNGCKVYIIISNKDILL